MTRFRCPLGAASACAMILVLLSGCGGSPDSTGTGAGGAARHGSGPEAYVDWPYFGRVPQRTHYLPARSRVLDPPLTEAWSVDTHGLIEFPPAIAGGVAYVVNKFGNGKAVRLRDRRILWEVNLRPSNRGKPLDVTGPAYAEGRVFGAYIDGYLAAADAASGKRLWVDKLHAHLESSPLAVDGRLYLGTDDADVICLRAADGAILWRFEAPGAVKASPSYDDGRIFVADYESSMFALDAATGRPVWRTNTSRVAPFGEGGFFSSPAIGFGRVYAARDDGVVYAFDERTGRVDWAFPTGAAVYGSPALAQVPGTPPTVYIGAEDGRFYALDARTGRLRWSHDVGGPIPGTATVIGHTVYTSSFTTGETTGFDVRTHRPDFHLKQAGYTPVVSDGRRLFLIGYFALVALESARRRDLKAPVHTSS
ncbi:MAG: PQQ-binding-like beta-propeller repeat protein [Syntrophothermus sp.]